MQVTVVGAHPDDIEVAAGGTIAALVSSGVDVLAIVAIDECDAADIRRAEATAALNTLGVSDESIEFLGLGDGTVVADVASTARLHWLLAARGRSADLVITHSNHDRHPDRRAVHAIVCGAVLPHHAVLGMSVVDSALDTFSPSIAVDTTRFVLTKAEALSCHRSQDALGRIRRSELALREYTTGAQIGAARAEAFEVIARRDDADIKVLSRLLDARWVDRRRPSIVGTR